MIFLEQAVNQILMEEGQVIVRLEDLQITWEDLEKLFIGVYEQAKKYIVMYDWVEMTAGPEPQKTDWTHVKHMTINNGLRMQRIMPDFTSNMWEFNPYTQNISSLANINYSIEAGMAPPLKHLDYKTKLDLYANRKTTFVLPCDFELNSFKFENFIAFPDSRHEHRIILESDNGVGNFDTKRLRGEIIMDTDYSGTLEITSKYLGIDKIDMDDEMFMTWFRGALLCYIGAMKKQLDLTGVGLPFDINADGLLERGRQYLDSVESTLKGTKSHWSEW